MPVHYYYCCQRGLLTIYIIDALSLFCVFLFLLQSLCPHSQQSLFSPRLLENEWDVLFFCPPFCCSGPLGLYILCILYGCTQTIQRTKYNSLVLTVWYFVHSVPGTIYFAVHIYYVSCHSFIVSTIYIFVFFFSPQKLSSSTLTLLTRRKTVSSQTSTQHA